MKVLFDHNVPYGLRRVLFEHIVALADEIGWAEIANGELLRQAEMNGFEVMVTCDQNLSYQQNLTGRKIALVILGSNNWKLLQRKSRFIVEAVDQARPSSFIFLKIKSS